MKKSLSLLLALAMVLTLLVGLTTATAEGEKPTIEFFYSPWASTPHDGYDPYEEYAESKYNADFVLTPATDFETQLLTRAAADDMPDLILFNSATLLTNVYNQGVLVEDWNPYLEKMPQTSANMSDLARAFLTVDGKLIACPAIAGDQKWSFMIRKDWLEALSLEMPTTDEEFLDVLRAFTNGDPDGDSEANTWGFTSAGGNDSVGELRNLLLLYSPGNFYITEDGAVEHYITDGSFLKYLQLARTIVSEGLIDPDWYTQGWDERKPNLYAGKFGVCWYPAKALLSETDTMYNDKGDTAISMWDIMPMYSGKLPSEPVVGALRSVSAAAAEDEAKMTILCDYLENGAYPNEDFFILRDGYKIDGHDTLRQLEDGTWFMGRTADCPEPIRKPGSIMFGWGQVIQAQGQNYIISDTDEPSQLNVVSAECITRWQGMDKWDGAYRLLNPDPTLSDESGNFIAEFEIDYILGNKTDNDFESFKETWLSQYGNELFADAEATFRQYGLID